MTEAPSDDEVLVTKWLMLGGVLWHSPATPMGSWYGWFAIERGFDEETGNNNMSGHTPTHAIMRYLDKFKHDRDHEWLAPLLEHVKSSTSSDLGPTTPHTAQ